MTDRGEKFVQMVMQFARHPENAEVKKSIFDTLVEYSKDIYDRNDLMNKFGFLRNCSKSGESKVIICNALVVYAHYGYLKEVNPVYTKPEKEWYENIILNTLAEVVSNCTIEEAYGRMGNFIS